MSWYDSTVKQLELDKEYSHNDLMSLLSIYNPDAKETSYNWAITSMLKSGIIIKTGYDEYIMRGDTVKPDYSPVYSEMSNKLIENIVNKFPIIDFTVFETVLLNEFLNHLIAQNTIVIQVEKDASMFVFRFLQEEGYENALYNPTKRDLELYWNKDVIIVTNMVSEAPLNPSNTHSICIEKMLVDIISDKCILASYSRSEYLGIINMAMERYAVDKRKMLRYARRRNREGILLDYLKRGEIINAYYR